VQNQFDDLREVRQTEPEKLLNEWKKLADQRDRQAEEYINKLKAQLKSSDSRKDLMSSSSDTGLIRANNHQEDWLAKEKKLKEEIHRLTQELSTSSLTLQGRTGLNSIGYSDEKAVRRLYEDLTGLVINKVETVQGKENNHFRSYHAIFASSGYYSEYCYR
jgi:hypothetical protein